MAGRRLGAGGAFNLRVGSEMDAQVIQVYRLAAPWAVWGVGLPAAAGAIRIVRVFGHHPSILSIGMFVGSVAITGLVRKVSAGRSKFARRWLIITTAAGMFWLAGASVVSSMFWPPTGLMWTLWTLGFVGPLSWNIRNSQHGDGIEDAVPAATVRVSQGPKFVDAGHVVRVIAGWVPGVRTALEAGSSVVPALGKPWEQAAIESGPADVDKVIEGKVVTPESGIDPNVVWNRILNNWRIFTTRKAAGRELNGARLKLVHMSSVRIKTKVILKRGEQLPKMLEDAREHLAVMNGFKLSDVQIMPNSQQKHGEAFVDWVLHDTHKASHAWEGLGSGDWHSIGDKEIEFGTYEDGRRASVFQPARPKKGKVLSHLGIEGMPGSGKSNFSRLCLAEGVRIYDVEDWVMDPVKAEQTVGCVAPAIDWVAVTKPEAENLIDFVMDITEARFRYLGTYGYDNWEPGCGLPFLRVWLEEGNVMAQIVGDRMEDVGNVARSAGVALNGSFQRLHSGDVPTGLRAVFGDTMSYGCKKPGDSFILPEALADAGADPTWGITCPGKLYWGRSDLDLDQQMITVRTDFVDPDLALAEVRRFAAEKRARIERDFPDWIAMLEEADTNGYYKNRTTGTAFRAKIDAAQAKRAEREAKKNGTTAPTKAEPVPVTPPPTFGTVEPEDTPPTYSPDQNEDKDMTSRDDNDKLSDPEYREGMERMQHDDNTYAREMGRLGGDPNWLHEIGDPSDDRLEIPIPRPDEVLTFGGVKMDPPVNRGPALAHLISFLAEKGPGWKFQPHDAAEACRPETGKKSVWYRTEVSTTLLTAGIVERTDRGEYRVATNIRSEETRKRIDDLLGRIPADA
jgi:hypothetical protein